MKRALTIKGLTKSYGDRVALGPLDLTVNAGQYVSLVGANGSGKTTLLRLITGLVDSSEGDISIGDFEVATLDARAAVSYIPDDPVLYDDLSVDEHIEYLGPLYGATDWQERGEQLLETFGLTQRRSDLPSGFSRGLRQKTSLVLGLLRPFEVLLVDEPFVGLDEPGRKALVAQLDAAKAGGATILLASHQLDLVKKADRLIALAEGQVTYDGKPQTADLDKLIGG
jgi:ABC-2 type transport system ATP-binding protein